ncbi:cytochrome c1 [Polymorphobacter sp. PAMC 29334]|uniref:cytochrome c1 n=1 Tax=Polymorphobacter sp. PAMC 29334 TaxID=2862331 RepID=UPI001C790A97|nr:cytochrome c1 [Polymorphobacter sp. PAMC 29334]QYE36025.1 cytochrome c1 [Polymorphobacter sp. PAMC 29334]
MVKLIAFLVGAVFCVALLLGAVVPRDATPADPVAKYHLAPKEITWQNDGIFGTFDRAQLQRGYQVYKEICSGCHSINRVAFRNLTEIGFTPAQVKALAKQSDVATIDDKSGDPTTRKCIPADKIPGPYANDTAARAANNNALPPNLALITKAREEGPRYVYSLLTGYRDAPKDWTVPDGLYYNPYFRSLNVAMPPPLSSDGQITYTDGTKSTVDQNAKDVAAFLTWTAEPSLEARKRTGVGVVIFLIILSALGYLSYQRVWADLKRKRPGIVPAE